MACPVGHPTSPALIVGLTLAAVQQFGRINTISYTAPTILEKTGLTASNSIGYAVAIGVINRAMTVVSIRLVDRVGRRPLLLASVSGMLLSLVLLGLSFVASFNSVVSLVFMVLYITAFAAGLGPVFWALIGEIFPRGARRRIGGGHNGQLAIELRGLVGFLSVINAVGQGQTFPGLRGHLRIRRVVCWTLRARNP